MFFHVSAYLFKKGIDDVVDEAVVIAETAGEESSGAVGCRAAAEVLERKRANSAERYPGSRSRSCPEGDRRGPSVASAVA